MLRIWGWICLLCVVICTCSMTAMADADVAIDVDPNSGSVSDTFTLRVTVTGSHAANVGQPIFEESKDFTVEPGESSTALTITNGEQNLAIIYSFNLAPSPDLKPGRYEIPQGSFTFNGRTALLKRPTILITAGSAQPTATNSDGLNFVQVVDNTAPYVGQQILYKAEVAASNRVTEAIISDMNFEGFWNESFGKAREAYRNIGGMNTKIYTVREALFPTKAGELTIPNRTLNAKVHVERSNQRQRRTPWDVFNDPFFSNDLLSFGRSFDLVAKRFVAPAVTLKVKALPPAPANGLKYIPVGGITVKASIDKRQVKQGDSVNLTIELAGDANLRPYELEEPKGLRDRFRVYSDKPSTEATPRGESIFFRKTFSLAFVPQVAGQLVLPSYTIIWFDPTTEQYRTENTEAFELEVIPDSAAQNLQLAGSTTGGEQNQPIRQSVNILGTDLLPQHSGSAVLVPKATLPRLYFYLLFLLPVAAFATRLALTRALTLMANPTLLRQLAAHRKLLEALRGVESGPAGAVGTRCADLLRHYISDRLSDRPTNLTAREAADLVEHRFGAGTLSNRIREFLQAMERMKYSGAAPSQTETSGLVATTRELAEEIERGLKK